MRFRWIQWLLLLQLQQPELASDNSRLRKSPVIFAESVNNLAKAKKVDDGHKEMHISITEFHHSNVNLEGIQLIQM
jgi:hypothetical protein